MYLVLYQSLVVFQWSVACNKKKKVSGAAEADISGSAKSRRRLEGGEMRRRSREEVRVIESGKW